MRVLVITSIFPNAQAPTAGPYNRYQFTELAKQGCTVEVLATIPWFPGADQVRKYSPYGSHIAAPRRTEVIDGLRVEHPRTFYIPKVGLAVAGPLYAASLLPSVARYRNRVDVVLGVFAYPDGWASVVIAGLLGVPAVVKCIGSDINVVAEKLGARQLMRWVLPKARIVAVSRQLGVKCEALGVPPDRIDVVHDGVDADTFRVRDRLEARGELGRDTNERMVVYVGELLRSKGVVDLLGAFERVARVDDRATCVIVGNGLDEELCRAAAQRIGHRVTFTGPLPGAGVAQWMAASNIVALPSWAEGTPNVVLEALACGRRVVASNVGGIPDLITSDGLGEMVEAKDIDGLASALTRALVRPYDPEHVAHTGRRRGWSDSARDLRRILERAIAQPISIAQSTR
jgi:glycosyltransferase involved in cell wall biosynthesis